MKNKETKTCGGIDKNFERLTKKLLELEFPCWNSSPGTLQFLLILLFSFCFIELAIVFGKMSTPYYVFICILCRAIRLTSPTQMWRYSLFVMILMGSGVMKTMSPTNFNSDSLCDPSSYCLLSIRIHELSFPETR